jgi:hypothetical protein
MKKYFFDFNFLELFIDNMNNIDKIICLSRAIAVRKICIIQTVVQPLPFKL